MTPDGIRKALVLRRFYMRIEGLSPEEPYISYLNESALPVLNVGGAA
jgi:hypothetical protein